MKLNRIETPNFFMQDNLSAGRLTHYPSQDTCLRHLWMHGIHQATWDEELKYFLKSHSDSHIVVDERFKIIGDANDFPQRGGELQVGDVVMLEDSEHGYCADKIIGYRAGNGTYQSDPDGYFTLESGREIYWDKIRTGWSTGSHVSVRRPLDGEEILSLEEKATLSNARKF